MAHRSYPWESLFPPLILERGWDSYQEGAVLDLRDEGEEHYTATVQGTHDYSVEIELENGIPQYMDCDCPYAEDGDACKHMAAVLYAVQELKKSGRHEMRSPLAQKRESIESIVERIPESDLRSILVQLCSEYDDVQRQIVLRYASQVTLSSLSDLKRDFERICRQHADRSGFIDWRNATDFEIDATSFLMENTKALLSRGEPMLAFQMVRNTLIRIGEQDIDDDGHLMCIASSAYDCWSMILDKALPDQKQSLFEWFSNHMNGEDMPEFVEYTIHDFYVQEFQEPAFLRKKLEQYKDIGPVPPRDQYHAYYTCQHKAMELLHLMEKLSVSEEEIQEQISRFHELPDVRSFAAEHALKQGDTAKALDILAQSKVMDCSYPGLVRQYSTRMIEIYRQEGAEDDLRRELLFHIFSCHQENLDQILLLKDCLSPAEWENQRKKILEAPTCSAVVLRVLASEGLYDGLLDRIIQSHSLYSLDQYEQDLKKHDPQQVRDAYISLVKESMDSASGRGQYAAVISYLEKIAGYPNGKKEAAQIAAQWRSLYSRRRAMMDELSRAGF